MKRLALLLVPLLFVALAVWLLNDGQSAVSVDVESVRRVDRFVSSVTASGEIVATRYADIGSDIMGRVVELAVDEGEIVTRGALLARLDSAQARSSASAAEAQVRALRADEESAASSVENARSQIREAEAQAEEAERKLDRARDLRGRGILSEAELEAAVAAAGSTRARLQALQAAALRAEQQRNAAALRVRQAIAQQEGASDLLGKTRILAPIDGTVTRLNVREGEMVVIGIQNQPGTTLMTISDLGELNAEVRVAEAEVPRLRVGQPAEVILEALPGRSFGGRVVEIGSSALPVQGTASAREFRVVVRLDAPDPELKPGFTCDAEIITEERSDALTVPLQAVVLRAGADGVETTGVFVVDGDRARFEPVETGIIGGIRMEVSGVGADQEVVTGPFQVLRTLQDGDPVTAGSS